MLLLETDFQNLFVYGEVVAGLEKLKICVHVLRVSKNTFCIRSVRCYFLHTEIAYMCACMQSVYFIVMVMYAHNLHYTLNIFRSFLFTYFYKMLHDSFR